MHHSSVRRQSGHPVLLGIAVCALAAIVSGWVLYAPSIHPEFPVASRFARIITSLASIPEDGILIGSDDFDQDEVADTLYAIPNGNTTDPFPRVQIHSGVDESLICTIFGDAIGDEFGAAVEMYWT